MRTDETAVAALDARIRIPARHALGDPPLLVCRSTAGERAVDRQRTHRQGVATPGHHRGGHSLHELGGTRWDHGRRLSLSGDGIGHRDLVERGQGGIDGFLVTADHLVTAPPVCLSDRALDLLDRLGVREHPGDGEEAGLQNGVGPAGQAGGAGYGVGVDGPTLKRLSMICC